MSTDPFRWCVYCGADCYLDRDDQQHKPDCPMTTGLYPVRAEDTDTCCLGCDHPFALGENYVYRDLNTLAVVNRPADGSIVSPYCVGCGAIPTDDE